MRSSAQQYSRMLLHHIICTRAPHAAYNIAPQNLPPTPSPPSISSVRADSGPSSPPAPAAAAPPAPPPPVWWSMALPTKGGTKPPLPPAPPAPPPPRGRVRPWRGAGCRQHSTDAAALLVTGYGEGRRRQNCCRACRYGSCWQGGHSPKQPCAHLGQYTATSFASSQSTHLV